MGLDWQLRIDGCLATDIHDTAVDVAEFLEAKEPRALGGVIENVGLCKESVSY